MRKATEIMVELKKHKDSGDICEFEKVINSMTLEEIENMEFFCEGMLKICSMNRRVMGMRDK